MIDYARECVGVPYLHQGRSLKGMDCCGVLVHVFKRLGLEYFDDDSYGHEPCPKHLRKTLDNQPSLKHTGKMGDVLIMSFAGRACHLALHSDGVIVHSYKSVGKVIEQRLCSKWAKRIVRGYSFV